MSYEYNPLLKLNFQKKSEVSPSDIERVESEISEVQTSVTDLQQKKVTKFFSVSDSLQDNEIAEYQGETDTVNNLINGYFYKKNPSFLVTYDETQQHSLSVKDFAVNDFNNQIALLQKYVDNRRINIDITAGYLEGETETENTTVIFEVSTDSFEVQNWCQKDSTTYAAPFVITLDANNNIIIKKANITYDSYRRYIDGVRFYPNDGSNSIISSISFDDNKFFFWIFHALNAKPFCFPLLIASSDYQNAKLIANADLPPIYIGFQRIEDISSINYYDYIATFNNTLFTRIDTQPGTVVDSELSDTSTNPVQNAVITNALSTKITNAGKSAQASTDAKSIYVITQSEYDALTNIIPDQLYFII